MDTSRDHEVRMQRALLSLEGVSVGDAFGEQLVAQPATVVGRMQRREVMPGLWRYSDDTVMAMSIVETLYRHGRIDQEWLALRFARKYLLDPTRGYGSRAHIVLNDIARGRPWRQAAGAAFGGSGSMGNGGAMRAAPIGAYFAGDLTTAAAEARLSAEVTHAHPEGQAGAMAVAAAAAWAALVGNGRRILVQDTVPFALWCACHHLEDYAEALWTAVSRFGDCDTLCAIVGGIVVMHEGERGIPEAWTQHREPLAVMRLERD
jgi:ADP-ribosylglycohydrolase